jgi:hypothetical protein
MALDVVAPGALDGLPVSAAPPRIESRQHSDSACACEARLSEDGLR